MPTTMVFTMRCFVKQLSTTIFAAALWLAAPAAIAQASGAGLVGNTVNLIPNVNATGWDLQAEFKVDLPNRLAELARSTPLYFVLDWRMNRPRWYWRDQRLAQGQLYWRFSHNPLTQQWRVSSATTPNISEARFAQTFNSLDAALNNLRKIRRDSLVQSSELEANQKYELSVRLRLDTSQLPKPFQINAITNNDWALDSGTLQHVFVSAAPVSAMVPVAPK
ncbi:MAG: hypothetical protein RL171_2217 [Pseudomonadota bacterium]